MNKADLVDELASRQRLSKQLASELIDALTSLIMQSVADGKKVTLTGFGTFEGKNRQARMGRNPITGESLNIPAKRIPTFSAGKTFKNRVSGN